MAVVGGVIVSCLALLALPAINPLAAARTAGAEAAPSPASGTGWIRFGHFVPSQGPVIVTVDNVVLGSNLVFRAVTPYVSIPAGMHMVSIRNSSAGASSAPLASGQTDVASGGAVTAAAVAGASGAAGSIGLQMYTDDLTAPAPGQAKVRVIHTVSGVPAVTTQLTATTASASAAALSSQPTLSLSPVTYGQASPYTSLAAGTYQLKVAPTTGPTLINGQNWPVQAGTVASIVLVAAATGPTVEVLSDAVGAASMPTRGPQTGFGGTAPRPPGPLLPLASAAAVLLLGAALVRRRLKPSPPKFGEPVGRDAG